MGAPLVSSGDGRTSSRPNEFVRDLALGNLSSIQGETSMHPTQTGESRDVSAVLRRGSIGLGLELLITLHSHQRMT